MKFDANTKHFICKKCGLFATREQVSDIRYRLNKREKTREDKHDEYRDWWTASKKDKQGQLQSELQWEKKKKFQSPYKMK